MQMWEKGSQKSCCQAHPACPLHSTCGKPSHATGTPVHSTVPVPQLQTQAVQFSLEVSWLQVLVSDPKQLQSAPMQEVPLHPQIEKHVP